MLLSRLQWLGSRCTVGGDCACLELKTAFSEHLKTTDLNLLIDKQTKTMLR